MVDTVVTRTLPEMRLVQNVRYILYLVIATLAEFVRGDSAPDIGEISDYFFSHWKKLRRSVTTRGV